jgi:hypothetical protein
MEDFGLRETHVDSEAPLLPPRRFGIATKTPQTTGAEDSELMAWI